MITSLSGRCVVFDLDDTLYDEIDFVRSGFAAVTSAVEARYRVNCGAELQDRISSGALINAFQDIAATMKLPHDAPAFMTETYRTHSPTLRPRPGIPGLLAQLRARDGVVACITDGRSLTQRAKLSALDLTALIDVVLISEETGHAKPDAHNFEEMMQRVRASEFWYVGDNPRKDFVAPNALGWRTVGVRAPFGIHRIPESEWPTNGQPERWVDPAQLPAVWDEALAGHGP